jgi:hypothetical protein
LARDGRGNIYADVANNIYKYIGSTSSSQPPVCGAGARIQLSVDKNTAAGQSATVEIDAKGIPQDGTTYWIEFASDRDFSNLLSGPSTDSVLILSSGSLVPGPNTIFARMQALDKCNQVSVSVDSITITKTAAGGLMDQDFPGSPINTYPNPVGNTIRLTGLSITKSYTIKLYNDRGNRISQLTVSGQPEATINSLSLQSGVYWLQLYDNTKNRKVGVITLLKR